MQEKKAKWKERGNMAWKNKKSGTDNHKKTRQRRVSVQSVTVHSVHSVSGFLKK